MCSTFKNKICIVGLQEMVELKVNNVMSYFFQQKSNLDDWEPLLKAGTGMYVVGRQQLVGLGIWVLCSYEKLSSNLLTSCEISCIRTAAMGMLGTKGALIAYFYLHW